MKQAIKREIKALHRIGYNRCFFFGNGSCLSRQSPHIHIYNTGVVGVDVYSWEREIAGKSNTTPDWDVDECEQRKLVLHFTPTREGFQRVYRLARLCVQRFGRGIY
ncbi:hypothetical protein [Enterobacter mori]|uniref:hypothetical protein n=1 Tax=Enterobacter mori TaxID=539813 RepID=UPI003B83FF60